MINIGACSIEREIVRNLWPSQVLKKSVQRFKKNWLKHCDCRIFFFSFSFAFPCKVDDNSLLHMCSRHWEAEGGWVQCNPKPIHPIPPPPPPFPPVFSNRLLSTRGRGGGAHLRDPFGKAAEFTTTETEKARYTYIHTFIYIFLWIFDGKY